MARASRARRPSRAPPSTRAASAITGSRCGSPSAASHTRRSTCHAGSASSSAASGAPAACASASCGSATPCCASHARGRLRIRQRHLEPAAAAHDGRRQPADEIRDQDEEGAGGRLLERLEQRVGGRALHPLRRRDHGDFCPLAMARQRDELRQRANALDPDGLDRLQLLGLLVDFEELDAHEVRMLAGDRVPAAGALPAGEAVGLRRLAQQRLREMERQRVLAQPARPVQQQRVRPRRSLRQRIARGRELPRRQRQPRQRDGTGSAPRGRRPSIPRPVERGEMDAELRPHVGQRLGAVDHAKALADRRRARARYAARTRSKKALASLSNLSSSRPSDWASLSRACDTAVGTSNR